MKQIYISLTTEGSVDKAIKSFENLKTEIHQKTQRFVEELISIGIDTAERNTGEYAGFITFKRKISPEENGCDGVLIATDGQKLIREWRTKDGVRSVEVSPILMAEFGSGWLASVLSSGDYRSNELGVGQGTFPGQTHAFDSGGWWWTDLNGEKHHSYGEAPTYPMQAAMFAMLFEIDAIGKRVFNG